MCGRYYNKRQKQEIAERLRVATVFEEPYPPNYNIAPTTFQPIVRQSRDTDDREMVLARWGLVPFFAKSLADFKGFSTSNARTEGIPTSATWRGPFKTRRCLVPVDGFYEWKKLDDAKKPAKQPFAISFRAANRWPSRPLGCVERAEEIAAGRGSLAAEFSIITTEANEIMTPIHNRMPVILAERDWQRWLDRDPEAPPPIDLLRPFDSAAMQTDPCNALVGNVRNNGPEMLNSA
jgi:putative SOS response-associated peptidase YedK